MSLLPFAVYITSEDLASQDPIGLLRRLCQMNDEEPPEDDHVADSVIAITDPSLINATFETIVAYHRSHHSKSNVHPSMFILVDKPDYETSGVLLAGTDVEDVDEEGETIPHDTPKAEGFRSEVEWAQPCLATIDVGQSDWQEKKETSTYGLQWDRYIAVYAMPSPSVTPLDGKYVSISCYALGYGLEGIQKQRYKFLPVFENGQMLGGTLDEVVIAHRFVRDGKGPFTGGAPGNQFHPQYFVYANKRNLREEGIVLVNMDSTGNVDSFSTSVFHCADAVTSIILGLSDWETEKASRVYLEA